MTKHRITVLRDRHNEQAEIYLDGLYGPLPENPFKRLRENNDETLADLSAVSGLDRRALQRAEYGMFNGPLPGLIHFWCTKRGQNYVEIEQLYNDYVWASRRRYRMLLGPTLTAPVIFPEHPLRYLRSMVKSPYNGVDLPVGLSEFCQKWCLPLDSIQHFEKKWRTQQSVPKVLKQALNQAGYSRPVIERFQNDYKVWRHNQLTNNVVRVS